VTEPAVNEAIVNLRTNGDVRVPEGLYDHILEAKSNLVILDTPFGEDVIGHLRQMAQRRGHSIYSWNAESGLSSLREHGITVAGSKRISEALRFVIQSGRFGVYVIPADVREFTPQVLALLRQIARAKDGGDKRVLMLGSEIEIPSPLDRLAHVLIHKHGLTGQLRLRDGRWIRG
jgi:hypothetical protein